MGNLALSREWPGRRVESYVAAAQSLSELVASMIADRDAWLAGRGLTIEQARALPQAERDELENAWACRTRI